MDKLRLLIVDDLKETHIILAEACKKFGCFELKELTDTLDMIDFVKSWHPHIIFIDIMASDLDGFEIVKNIKEQIPETIIVVMASTLSSDVKKQMSVLGIEFFIDKPIDMELLEKTLQDISLSLRFKLCNIQNLSKKIVLNPFNSNIRSFKTIFDIADVEAMMDFGMWLGDQYSLSTASEHFDNILKIFYMLMREGNKNRETMNIVVEESYEEFYITMKFDSDLDIELKLSEMLQSLGSKVFILPNIVCMRLSKVIDLHINKTIENVEKSSIADMEVKITTQDIKQEKIQQSEMKEVRVVQANEKELLRQSFVNKTSAQDYINEIGGDVLDEIRDLSSLDEEWILKIRDMELNPTVQTFTSFADSVVGVYVKTINNLFEFTSLAYALSALGTFIKHSADEINQDSSKVKLLVMLLEHLGTDLTSWREHIFILQDTADIHYLDSSFFSSCVQIEGIVNDKDIGHDDDNDMEFF